MNIADTMPRSFTPPKPVDVWDKAKIGEVCTRSHLEDSGGIFYSMDNIEHCDMLTATFK